MFRWFFTTLMGLALAGPGLAHFVFIVPQPGDKGIQVVFSESLAPDKDVDIGKIAALRLTVRDAAGKESALKPAKGAQALTADLAGEGLRIVYGSLDYGVLQRGDSKPFLLRYYPKAIIGDAFAKSSGLGDRVPVEVIPVGKTGAVRFQVVARGKPLANAEVNLVLAADKKRKVMTDKEGMTPLVEARGRLGAWVRFTETRAGESGDKKYEEVRNYGTLVVDLGDQ